MTTSPSRVARRPGPTARPPEATALPSSAPTSASPSASSEIPVTITIGDTVLMARLAGHATAQDLAAQLPLTLSFADFHSVEKIARLPRPLSLDGAPAGADPDVGDLGYYAPSGDLVFYYGDVGYFPGIVRIGRLDSSMELVERQGDHFRAMIDRAR